MKLRLLGILFLGLAGCASSQVHDFDKVQVGMDKDQVLEKLDNPTHTFRESMQDHWQYVYYKNDRKWSREIIFDDGKVVKITQPQIKEEWVKDLENTKTMEEYEEKARDHQKKAEKFKSIDGEADEKTGP